MEQGLGSRSHVLLINRGKHEVSGVALWIDGTPASRHRAWSGPVPSSTLRQRTTAAYANSLLHHPPVRIRVTWYDDGGRAHESELLVGAPSPRRSTRSSLPL